MSNSNVEYSKIKTNTNINTYKEYSKDRHR